MSDPSSLSSFARALAGGGPGGDWALVLRAYFDDSGTHDGAPILLWAGMFGNDAQWDEFEGRWNEVLKARGLAHFHMTKCEVGDPEYGNRADRDHTIYLFRSVILETRLTPIVRAVRMPLFREVMAGVQLPFSLNEAAEMLVLAQCVFAASDKAAHSGYTGPLNVIFDNRPQMVVHASRAMEVANQTAGREDRIGFAKMGVTPAIQGADLFAWEIRNYVEAYDAGSGWPRAHFKPFMDTVHMNGHFFSRDELEVHAQTARDAAKGHQPPHRLR